MSRLERTSSLFRGSERARLILLTGIVLAGWPAVYLLAQNQVNPPPPPPGPAVLTVEDVKPVVAEKGVEFQAIVDKAALLPRETAAYATLLQKARDTSPADLARAAHRDVLYTHLWERPQRYRGVPVHVEGTAVRVLTYPALPQLSPKERLFEAWVYSNDNRSFPYSLVFEDPPKGFPLGAEVSARVAFDGYFFKLLGYRAGDNNRAAPLLVGRLTWTPTPRAAAEPDRFFGLTRREGIVLLFSGLFVYLTVRVAMQLKKVLDARPNRAPSVIRDEADAPNVVEWLHALPAEDDEPEPEHHESGSR